MEPITLRPASEARLEAFCALLLRWNKTINLISRQDETILWERHVRDSLQLAPLIPPDGGPALDLGSGGGFPGLVLSIATDTYFNLAERDHRKAAFLREAIRVTGARAEVHACRIEALHLPPLSLVTARALAPLDTLLVMAAPFLTPTGHCLFLKGEAAQAELAQARRHWHMTVRRTTSVTDPRGFILDITGLRRADASG